MNAEANSARKSIVPRSSFIVCLATCLAIVGIAAHATHAPACPFCLADEPTFAQRRENADAVALGEAAGKRGDQPQTFQLHTIFKGPGELKKAGKLAIDSPDVKKGSLAILFGTADDRREEIDRWDWSAAFANEALLGYFAKAPDLRQPPAKRLAYFARYLEHADRDIARDAYLEFGHAPYDDVAKIAGKFDFAKVRRWLKDPQVPEARKGLYGLILGMAQRDEDRAANKALFLSFIEEDRGEFRAGFDGILAGYLLLAGKEGLEQIEQRYFVNTQARHGDVRHAMKAVRFYYEYGPQDLRAPIAAVVAPLVERPAFAAAAITDLARWEHWQVLDQVAPLYEREGFADGPIRRAIIGYLHACPKPEAAQALARLKERDPTGVEAAERLLFLPAGK
jgi:hypothetical protein